MASSTTTVSGGTRSALRHWWQGGEPADGEIVVDDRIDWLRLAPFIALHLSIVAIFWVGVSPIAVAIAASAYFARMFFITAFYHRYFSHRTFRTSRAFQFVMAFLGCTAGQRGPIWWAAQHRHHHQHSDEEPDSHSPVQHSLIWSHMLWFMTRSGFQTPVKYVKDWWQLPELRLLERLNWVPTVLLAGSMYATGAILARVWPESGTTGWQVFMWGYVVSTLFLYHATYTINSLAHKFGRRRFDTKDESRNNLWLALLTLGEGWHNNHHHYPTSVRQGFYWWEVDISYYLLVALSWTGLISGLRPVPQGVLDRGRSGGEA
ncbi:MAG: acyl-CoA desaturase [Planctomycetota bacterium]